jgi:hypothetical protein
MRANTVTVTTAIRRYWLGVAIPFFVVFFGGIAAGVYLLKQYPSPYGIVTIVSSVFLPVVWSMVAYNRWFVWAFINVNTPNLLYRRALRSEIVFPRNSWKNKLCLRIGATKEELDEAWNKAQIDGNIKDIEYTLPASKIVEIKFSYKKLIGELIGGGMFIAAWAVLVFYFKIELKTFKDYLIHFGGLFLALYIANDLYKQSKKAGKLALKFSPDGLVCYEDNYWWYNIAKWRIEKEGEHDYFLWMDIWVVDPETYTQITEPRKCPLNGLDATPDRIEELFTIYKELYTPIRK